VKLLLDEMYPQRLAEQLRDAGHDVLAVVERPELVCRPDEEIAGWARDHQRVVVTENVADFLGLEAQGHAGLLLLNARRWPRTPSGLGRICSSLDSWLKSAGNRDSVVLEWLSA
jgi:hypothetical protein